jgi:hypothetical protein
MIVIPPNLNPRTIAVLALPGLVGYAFDLLSSFVQLHEAYVLTIEDEVILEMP